MWLVFGVAAVAKTYLNPDKSIAMHQGRSGSDVYEHFFCIDPLHQSKRQAPVESANYFVLAKPVKKKRKLNKE